MGTPTTLLCKRLWFTEKSTISELFIRNEFQCFILEDPVRNEIKIQGETAIPFGKYELSLRYSDHFEMLLPLFIGVPNFEGIEFHPGNKPTDTRGCPLPGMIREEDLVLESRRAHSLLMPKIKAAIEVGKVFWEVIDGRIGAI